MSRVTKIVLIVLVFSGIVVLLMRQCAPCAYKYNNRNYKSQCSDECVFVPTWKILIFNLTGKIFEIQRPDITK